MWGEGESIMIVGLARMSVVCRHTMPNSECGEPLHILSILHGAPQSGCPTLRGQGVEEPRLYSSANERFAYCTVALVSDPSLTSPFSLFSLGAIWGICGVSQCATYSIEDLQK